MAEVRWATKSDKDFWLSIDKGISEEMFLTKVAAHECMLISVDGSPAGILRYSLFWDSIPFCNLLYIADKEQRKGYGTTLLQCWEHSMHEAGFNRVLVSTQADEQAQFFYRGNMYCDCGALLLNLGEPAELILQKGI